MEVTYLCRNAALLIALTTFQCSVYFSLNHHPLRPSRQLPLTALDEAVPFLVWTVWPYLVLMASGALLPLPIRAWPLVRQVLLAYTVALALTLPFWVFLPTTYPRPACPSDSSWTALAYRLLIGCDSPECCFPSAHIFVPALGGWGLARDRPRWGPWLLAGLAVLALSVLTTKQHYLWDLLGGLAVAVAGATVAAWLAPARRC